MEGLANSFISNLFAAGMLFTLESELRVAMLGKSCDASKSDGRASQVFH